MSTVRKASEKKNVTLAEYTGGEIRKFKEGKQSHAASNYRTTLSCIARYLDGSEVRLSEIDKKWVAAYRQWLVDQSIMQSTVSFYLRVLRAVYNRAVADGVCKQRKPFDGINTVYPGSHKEQYHNLQPKRALDKDTIDDIATKFGQYGEELTLGTFADSEIERFKEQNRLRTAGHYRSMLRSVSRFLNGGDIALKDITAKWVKGYEQWLLEQSVGLNGISFYMRNLRAVYNKAVKCGLCKQRKPFAKISTQGIATERRTLTQEQMEQIENLELAGGSSDELARDLFLFSFYANGMALIDIAHLRKSDVSDGVLTYTDRFPIKTETIPWDERLQKIAGCHPADEGSPYIFPILKGDGSDTVTRYDSFKVMIGSRLNRIGKRLGFEFPLIFRLARNSRQLRGDIRQTETDME